MITWSEILKIKTNKLVAERDKLKLQQDKKLGIKFLLKYLFYTLIFGAIIYWAMYINPSKEIHYSIGQEIKHSQGFGDIKLYQLGERKLTKLEQEKIGYKSEKELVLVNTNTISEKYFVDNNTNYIGKIADTLLLKDEMWLQIQLEKNIYKSEINFDEISNNFSVKLHLLKHKDDVLKMKDDIYVNLNEVINLLSKEEK
jgi:hypothetical protein